MENKSKQDMESVSVKSEGKQAVSQQGTQTVGSFLRNFFPNQQPKAIEKITEGTEAFRTGENGALQTTHVENKPLRLRGTSRLCKNTVVKGEITSEENLIVDGILNGPIKSSGDVIVSGNVKGDVESSGKCSISQGGEIIGDVTCQNAEISGTLHGNLHAECCVVLLDGAIMEGDIVAASIRTAAKAQVRGHLDIGQTIVKEPVSEKDEVRKLAAQNADRQTVDAVLKGAAVRHTNTAL